MDLMMLAVVAGLATVTLVLLRWRWRRRVLQEVRSRTITEQVLRSSRKELENFLRLIDDHTFFARTDTEGIITYVSKAYCRFLGFHPSEMLGFSFRLIRHPETSSTLYSDLWSTIKSGSVWRGELQNRKKDGTTFWAHVTITPVYDEAGHLVEFQSHLQDITAQKKLEALSVTDELTGLHNRRRFNETYPQEIRRTRREGRCFAFAILDIDHFKRYNDTYGHQPGDFVLQSVGEALRSKLQRPSDYAFRLGGEEFGVLFSGLNYKDSMDFVTSILAAIEELGIVHAHSEKGVVTASAGLIWMEKADPGLEREYYSSADDLLYQAKAAGRDMAIGKSFGS